MVQTKGPAARPLDVDEFLRLILKSGLLDREQLQSALKSLPNELRTQTTAIAEHLVKLGKLSRFQARKLALGQQRGLVLGPFQVLAPIGRGGMGTVYLSRDQRSGQLLALKVLPPERAKSEERILARFRREMEMSQKVSHPHIAWTFDVGVCQDVHYLAMEYIPGKSLQRIVSEQGPLPVARIARLLSEISTALEHLHAQGLVHRDVKPANIMVTPHDHARLLDLGMALVRGETGGAREVVGGQGYVVGTMDYIAPEQIENPTGVDGRADIYSLGCTLYYSLTGQPPFPGGSNKEKMYKQREEKPKLIEELNRKVPIAFIAVVERMMAKNLHERFQTAHEVELALKPWSVGDGVLPLDRPEDLAFLQAVAHLEAAEASEDVDVLAGMPTPEPHAASLALLRRNSATPIDTRKLIWLSAAGVAVGILIVVLIIVLASH